MGRLEKSGNLILDSFTDATRSQVLSVSRLETLDSKARLFQADETATYIYFITEGVASVMMRLPEDGSCELAILGRASAPGATALLSDGPAGSDCEMQIAGSAYRISVQHATALFKSNAEFQAAMLGFISDFIRLQGQVAVCTCYHSVERRLARWLLSCSDLAGSQAIPLTQESLAQLLSARRSTIAEAAAKLQRDGIVAQRRGVIEILDTTALMQRSCACYQLWREIFLRRRQRSA